MVGAFRCGLFFVEEDDGKNMQTGKYRLAVALVLTEPDKPEVIEALKILGVTPGRKNYIIRPPTDAMPEENDPYAIWVTSRSMIDVISLASHFVEVPAEHSEIVPAIDKTERTSSDKSIPFIQKRTSLPIPGATSRLLVLH